MENLYSLSALKPGQQARVEKLYSKKEIRRRLQDMGLIEGTNIKCVLQSPFKDPRAFFIRGAVISLRKEVTDTVKVSEIRSF